MKIRTRLLFIAALLTLALPFIFTGNAGAVPFNPDGAILDPATGLWTLPSWDGTATSVGGCFDGTATINATKTNMVDCRNLPIAGFTSQVLCANQNITITSPAGWTAKKGNGVFTACDKGGYTTQATCEAASGVWGGLTRCNRELNNTACTAIGGFTATTSSNGRPLCRRTDLTAANCALQGGAASTGGTWGGFAATTTAGVTTCTAYPTDATACTASAGTLSFANVDETRGTCNSTLIFKDAAGDWSSANRNNCTKCHQSAYMDGLGYSQFGAPVAVYVNASHKNASRKIVPGSGLANVYIDTDGAEQFGVFPYLPGLNMLQSNSTVSPNFNIRMVDWVNGKIEDTTTNSAHVGLANLPTGVYTEWYWEFGYYGEDPERGVYNGAAGSNGKPSSKMQACFACHATGYVGKAAVDTTMEPEKSFPGISWDGTTTYAPSSRPGKVNFIGAMTNRATNVKTTSTYGAWDQYGVVCSKCHNVQGGHASGGSGVPMGSGGAQINAVCGQCHIRAGSGDWAVTAGTGVLTTRAQVGTGHPNYHATDFLNSPHARFTGTYGQVNNTAMYNSAFSTNYAGCVGCHNPHGSVREPLIVLATGSAAPAEGIEETCADCHTTVTSFRHPTDPNKPTPWGTPDACVTCHMPSGRHMFRITTDVNYTTTAPTAFPVKADGTFTEAVWVDLKSACQQCHSGHVEGIPFIQTADLRNFAMGMHGGPTSAEALTANFTTVATGLSVAFTATGCPDADCTYKWNFGDDASVNTATATTSHTYASAGNYSAQVIVVDDTTGNNGSKAKAFALTSTNVAPVAAMSITQEGFTVNVIDASTDDAVLPAGAVFVDWGNGTTSTGNAGSTISKTYTVAGSYIIKHKVTDAGGKVTWSGNTQVTVPIKYNVTGSVMRLDGTTPVAGASIRLKLGAQVVKMTTTNALGAYTLQSVAPGSYTVEAVKSGLAFSSTPAAVVTNGNVAAATILATR